MTNVETMLDMYLFETTTLLEQLDEILISAEKTSNFSKDDINEIFRIMHTIKGSSAMMEYNSLMSTAHVVEDLFYYIRENGTNEDYISPLFDLMFESADILKQEIEKIQAGEPLIDNIDSFSTKINDFLKKIKTNTPIDEIAVISANSEPTDKSNLLRLNVLFDLDSSMENLRALLLVNSINDFCSNFSYFPLDIETNKETANYISDMGFDLYFDDEIYLNKAIDILKTSTTIRKYEILNNDTPTKKLSNSKTKVKVFFDFECGMENLRALMIQTSLFEVISDFSIFPADIESNSETAKYISDNGFDIVLNKSSDVKSAIDVVKCSSNIRDYEVIENFIDESINTNLEKSNTTLQYEKSDDKVIATTTTPNKQSLISVNLQKLDNLMNIVGEIVITESMVTSSPEIELLHLDNFTKSARQLRKLTDELQDIVMSIRMVPVSGVFQKMNRIVRDMDKKLKKPVELVMVGEHTEVDKAIVDGISDPIMHLVRNAMDHGIEQNSNDRIALGKSATGKIILSAQHTGSDVLISISDDGKGIDPAIILKKASEKGLLTKPDDEYTPKEILNLLMMPGFSTKEEVTEFSGRGVGLDVVKKNIEKIGGTVTINSDIGKGTTTVFKIPLTLAIASCMKVSVGNAIYAIPIMNIKQSFKANPESIIYDTDNNEIIKWMDKFYKVLRLHNVYNIENSKTELLDGIMVLVEADDKSFCMFVDELLGEQQVVVKPLPNYLSVFNIKDVGIAGCTILGDGQISLILDILNLYNMN